MGNSVFAVIFKNLVLFVLISLSLVFVFTNNIGYHEIRYIFLGMGLLYVVAACFEAFKLSQLNAEVKKFMYLPDGFFAKRFIKTVFLIVCGIVLLYSQSIIKYLAFLCFLIAFTEVVVTLWRQAKHLCFVAFDGGLLILSTNKIESMHATDIAKIEERHGLTYFVGTNQKAITLRTDMMNDKEGFRKSLQQWIIEHHLSDKVMDPKA